MFSYKRLFSKFMNSDFVNIYVLPIIWYNKKQTERTLLEEIKIIERTIETNDNLANFLFDNKISLDDNWVFSGLQLSENLDERVPQTMIKIFDDKLLDIDGVAPFRENITLQFEEIPNSVYINIVIKPSIYDLHEQNITDYKKCLDFTTNILYILTAISLGVYVYFIW